MTKHINIEDFFSLMSAENAKKLEKYYEMLIEWNSKFNLTAITERQDVFIKHFLDSLSALKFVDCADKLLDIGCGAGLPSIPLKLALPSINAVLLDSVNKKIGFVNAVIKELQLNDIIAIHSRIEEHREREYGTIVARALAPLQTLAEYTLPFLKLGGRFIAYKSFDCDLELREAEYAIRFLGGETEEIKEYTLPVLDIKRRLIVIKKAKPSPIGFPRGKNLPRTKPLNCQK